LEEVEKPQAMAGPVYEGIDLIALTFAVVLAAAIVLLLSHLMLHLADLLLPPALGGAP
jgi:hypothetical protein